MNGFIVVNADTGRALRRGRTAVFASAVLDCSGGFRAGDRVHVVVRGRDGGQGVVAVGVIGCDARWLSRSARGLERASAAGALDVDRVVIREDEIEPMWSRAH